MAKPTEYWKLGAAIAVLGSFVMGFLSELVSKIPGVSLDLQSISISTTGVGSVVNPGLQKYAQMLFGLLPSQLTGAISGMDWLFLAAGGAASLIVGAFAVEWIAGAKVPLLSGAVPYAKSKQGKLATIFVVAGLVTGAILSMSVGIPTISGAIVMAVDGLILSYLAFFVDGMLPKGMKLIP